MNCTRVVNSGSNTFLLRVDNSDNGDIQGVVDSVSIPAPIKFNSFSNLVFQLEEALDQAESMPANQTLEIRKTAEDFTPNVELEVLFRQNHSWQGKVSLLEKKKEAAFRSVLELLILFCTEYESEPAYG